MIDTIETRVALAEEKVKALKASVDKLDARLWAIIVGVAATTTLQLLNLALSMKHQ